MEHHIGQYEIFIFIVCVTALLSYLNHRFVRLSPTIGIMALSLAFSILVISLQGFFPDTYKSLKLVMSSIDFHKLLMNGMLGFLLFAGAIHIDATSLKAERWPIIGLATFGTFLSTAIIGTLFYFLLGAFQINIDFIYCLLFAALISPTDPIAVLAILKRTGLPQSLELKIAGESLFNDGVAVVIFLTLYQVAQTGLDNLSGGQISILFLQQAGGGLVYGAVLGYVTFFAIQSIDKYEVEVLITIATVMGGYLLAELIHVSGPLAMVVAGIVVGNKSKTAGVSDITRDYLHKFWELIDEMLNAALFMLIGFEMLEIKFNYVILSVGTITIFLVLFARWVSVALPVTILRGFVSFEKNAILILTWGGLRGGLSVALALSLPKEMYRDQFVAVTYMIVVFSIIVQGLTIDRVYKRLSGGKGE
ncbi:MAG: sodium:proton antiporter [Taibaiella sp.]|nr:sodium:proton antiporter [Taibaiella sp.]